MEDYECKNYLKIKRKDTGEIFSLGEYYLKFKEEKLSSVDENFYGMLSDNMELIYKGKPISISDYNNYLKRIDDLKIFDFIDFNNKYIQIIYNDIQQHHMHARFNLLKGANYLLGHDEYNWDAFLTRNIDELYIGMYIIRNAYIINSVISYSHIVEKLYVLFEIIFSIRKTSDISINKKIKEITMDIVEKKYRNIKTRKYKVNGIDLDLYVTFLNEIKAIKKYANDNKLNNFTNHFKHRGFLIENGLKFSLGIKLVHDENVSFIAINDESVYNDSNIKFYTYDIDDLIEKLYNFSRMIEKFIYEQLSYGLLSKFKNKKTLYDILNMWNYDFKISVLCLILWYNIFVINIYNLLYFPIILNSLVGDNIANAALIQSKCE